MSNQEPDTQNQNENNQLSPEQQEAANFAATLQSIKRDDGSQKFDTVDKALQSIQPKDDHIKSLETQVADLNKRLETAGTQEEILKKFMDSKTPEGAPLPEANSLDQDAVSKELSKIVDAREAAKTAEDNSNKVAQALAKVYGDKGPDVLSSKAREMNISETLLKEVIAKSPESAFEILGLSKTGEAGLVKLSGSQNTEGFNKAAPQQPKSVLGNMFINQTDVRNCWDGCHPDNYME